MALNFTDEQIRELTGRVLASPQLIASAILDRAKAVQLKQDWQDLDDANEVYTNHFQNIIDRYHQELKYLNGQIRTNYDLNNIQTAGELAANNVHFPAAPAFTWVGMEPMKVDSNVGLPIGTLVETETFLIGEVTTALDLMKNGFNDGANSDTTATAFVVGVIEVTNGGFALNDRVLFVDGSDYLLGEIIALDPTPPAVGLQGLQILEISSSNGFGGIGVGATADDNHPGFNNTQRETLVGDAYLDGLKAIVDTNVGNWETGLLDEQDALNNNDPFPPEDAEVTVALADVVLAIADINTWQAAPVTGAGTGRFGDTVLTPLESRITTRLTELAPRAAEIIAALGTLTQAGDGSFSGAGQYFTFFANLNLRINKAGGTLRNFYQSDLIIKIFDQTIFNLQTQANRDAQVFDIRKFTADGDGTLVISVDDASGLVGGEAGKVMSDTQPVIDIIVQSVLGNDITLDVTISTDYTVSEQARLVF